MKTRLMLSRKLRSRAEAASRRAPGEISDLSAEQAWRLVQELEVHQLELETQNEELRQAQAELARSTDRLSDLYDFAPVGYVTLDSQGTVVEANLTTAKMLGVPRNELLQKKFYRFVEGNSQDTLFLHVREVFINGTAHTCKLALRRGDGTALPVRLESLPFQDWQSKRCHAALIDLTSAERAEAALFASEEQYRLMFEQNPNPMWIFDQATRRFLAANEAAVNLYGWSRAEFLRMTANHVWVQEPKPAQNFDGQGDSRAVFVGERQHWKKDGTRLDVGLTISSLHFQGRKARLMIVKDITEEKQARERSKELNATLEWRVTERTEELTRLNQLLGASQQALADFFAEAPLGLLWVARDGQILRANRAFAAMLGGRVKDLLGRHFAEFCANPEVARVMAVRLARKELVRDYLVRLQGKDKSVLDVLIDANGAWQGGRLTHSRWFIRDVTRRIELQKELLGIEEGVRRQIGQDLHDDLCQQLTGIEYLSRALERQLGDNSPAGAARARKLALLARQSITHTRELSHRMTPMELPAEGLPGALKNLAAETKRLFQIDCRFRGNTRLLMDDSTAQTNLYRIAQEAIQNAIKHGKARRIQIGLAARGSDLVLSVQDNGVGLRVNPHQEKGYGLRIMDYRASTLGGSLVVRKGKRGGTSLVCSIPYGRARAATDTSL